LALGSRSALAVNDDFDFHDWLTPLFCNHYSQI
jgi:hypothetical protein